MMCGGPSKVMEPDAEVHGICTEVKGDVEGKIGKSLPVYTPVAYTTQVVAGTNFFVKIHLGDAEYVHVRIFRPLPHTNEGPSVHSYQHPKTEADELAYF